MTEPETCFTLFTIAALLYSAGTHLFLFDGEETLGFGVSLERQYATFFLSPLVVPLYLLVWVFLMETEILESLFQHADPERL